MKRLLCTLLTLLLLALCLTASAQEHADGIYRGFYYDGGIEQLSIQFEMEDGLFKSIVFRGVRYKDGNYMSADASDAQKAAYNQYLQLAEHLIGKGVDAIADLYTPYDFVGDADAVTSATIQSSKLISALWDGLNRRPYKLTNNSRLPQAESYADGTYRGSFMEDGGEQVALEFTLKDGIFTAVTLRSLGYRGQDYMAEDADPAVQAVAGQFRQLTEYLVGKPVSAVNDLYTPGSIASDVDGFTGATIRSPKVISAVWDALNRTGWPNR